MNYQLIKQLDEAGYKGNFDLSTLIEACGDRFALHKNKDHWVAWIINSNPKDTKAHDLSQRGTSPEEAVARLWLELNKK